MTFAWRLGSILFGAVVALALGYTGDLTAAPIKPEKGKDDEYSKKLVGVWEGKEEAKDGGKPETLTVEFKADGSFKITMGPFDVIGTWMSVKEEGKTLTVDTEATLAGLGKDKSQKKTFSIVFDDVNTIVMSPAGAKADPKTLRRKP